MVNRPNSGNVWGIHIDIEKSSNSAFLYNIKNPYNKVSTRLLKKSEISDAFNAMTSTIEDEKCRKALQKLWQTYHTS